MILQPEHQLILQPDQQLVRQPENQLIRQLEYRVPVRRMLQALQISHQVLGIQVETFQKNIF